MINYINSELYRLFRKKGLYVIFVISFLLVFLAIKVVSLVPADTNLSTSVFYYDSILYFGGMTIAFLGLVFSLFPAGKDLAVMKQSVASGISRACIFLTKFFLTLIPFVIMILLDALLAMAFNNRLLSSDVQATRNFWLAITNLLPLLISAAAVSSLLSLLKFSPITSIMLLFFGYTWQSGSMIHNLIFSESEAWFSKYFPADMIQQISNRYLAGTIHLGLSTWLVGGGITIFALVLGLVIFTRKDIR